MRRLGSLIAGPGSFVEAFLTYFIERGAAWVGVIETAVCTAICEEGAVCFRGHGEDVKGRDGVY